MTRTAAADAVVPACAHAAAACPPTAGIATGCTAVAATDMPRQRDLGCASPLRALDVLRADLATPGWPSDPGREVL